MIDFVCPAGVTAEDFGVMTIQDGPMKGSPARMLRLLVAFDCVKCGGLGERQGYLQVPMYVIESRSDAVQREVDEMLKHITGSDLDSVCGTCKYGKA